MSLADTQRATTAQKAMLLKRLAKGGLISRRQFSSDRTGPQWRSIFRAANTPEPRDVFSWPTVDDWIGGLSVGQASAVIKLLMDDPA
ncbi:MAG: hypothetical protein ACYCZD_12930 [Rhodanobacter sp.]